MKLSTLVFLFGFLFYFGAKAQCSVCAFSVADIDTNSYTLNTGQVLCIDTAGIVKGTVVMNGGTVCNKGVFKPSVLSYTSGNFFNEGNISLPSALTLASGSSLTNGVSSVINFAGTLTNSGATITNDGIFNIETDLQNTSGTLTNNNIINCQQVAGSGTITNNGVINSN